MENNMENTQQAAAPQSKGTNGLAIAALITGLLSLNVIAIILGFIALNQIKKTGEGGKGMAIAGIILGFISLAIWLFVVIFFVWFTAAVTPGIIQSQNSFNELNDLFEGLNELNSTNFNVEVQ